MLSGTNPGLIQLFRTSCRHLLLSVVTTPSTASRDFLSMGAQNCVASLRSVLDEWRFCVLTSLHERPGARVLQPLQAVH